MRYTIDLDDGLVDTIRRAAEKRGRKHLSDMLREILVEWVSKEEANDKV